MNKIVLLALLGLTTAIRIRDDSDFNDDDDTRETLKSIATAEKSSGYKFSGLSKDEEKVLINSRNVMKFDEQDNMLTSAPKKVEYLDIGSEVIYPEARPIGEILMQFEEDQEDQVLTGFNQNDEEEYASTLASIKESEASMGR
jgi:hypothetical protein